MSKYFSELERIIVKPLPTFEERVKEAIIDLEKRIDALEGGVK